MHNSTSFADLVDLPELSLHDAQEIDNIIDKASTVALKDYLDTALNAAPSVNELNDKLDELQCLPLEYDTYAKYCEARDDEDVDVDKDSLIQELYAHIDQLKVLSAIAGW